MPTEAPPESADKAQTSNVAWSIATLAAGGLLVVWVGYYFYQKKYAAADNGELNGLDSTKYSKIPS